MGHYFASDGTPFCTGWDTIWDTILTDGTPNGTLFCPDGTPNGTRTDTILPEWDTKGHQWTPFWCPMSLWSSIRVEEGCVCSFWRPGGCKIGLRSHKRTRSRFAILAGCGILLPTGFQPCKGGDMMCARGPLGAIPCRHLCQRGRQRGVEPKAGAQALLFSRRDPQKYAKTRAKWHAFVHLAFRS